ncbi:hypothetical protein [Chryseobacterium foetidum]|uniref:hypothetical protein n=1 Tax=Chryseobacterium foetidum TaxID=2951057 RepID=UPI0021C965F6|nr:hypothetical protein [Chryseobacterium foetidum]
MASGFITLPDGNDWSARWSTYDFVLEAIMKKLASNGEEGYLKKWLEFILPNEENGDIECGYCFYKKIGSNDDDFVTILRIIDTNLMKQGYYEIFWNTVAELNQEIDPGAGDIGFLINELNNCFLISLSSGEKYIFPEKDDVEYGILNIGEFKIGL